MIVYEHSAVLDHVPDGGPEIEHGDGRLPLLASGAPRTAASSARSAPKRGTLVYHEYAAGDRRVTYENRGDSVWEVSEGRVVDAATIEVPG